MRDAIQFFLEVRTPFKVCGGAGDAIAAIEKAREFSCDLILLDLSVPMLTGVETASVSRSVLPRAKIIGFSMVGEEFGSGTLAPASFDAVLSKHEGLTKLTATMRNLLAASSGNKLD